ncbi:hypothetical protein BDW22DRAFT_1426536 [Trametopsis cervina]|nr:hypothetical protein BDW22DRAFT_1426536 [Trametopsis cervina]
MAAKALTFLLLCAPIPTLAAFSYSAPGFFTRIWSKRSNVPPQGYFNPTNNGGSLLTQVPGTFPAGLGEPLNVIISGNSDPDVLKDDEAEGGLRNYFLSFGYAAECLGQHLGDDQAANLGDGDGYVNETAVIRWDYGDPQFGSCKETIEGGPHFRYWTQHGDQANSGAVFIAASYELPAKEQHDIVLNGYNFGRDWMIGNATNLSTLVPTFNLTNGSTFSGSTSFSNFTYHTDVVYLSGLLQNSSDGINHYITVSDDGRPAIDGLVAVMQVSITARPPSSSSALSSVSPASTWTLLSLAALLISILTPL